MIKKGSRPWRHVGSVDPKELVDARLQLHWATQVVSAFADAAFERVSDDSQSNLGWMDGLDILLTRRRHDGRAAALRPSDLELSLVDDSGAFLDRFKLSGRTLADAVTWVRQAATGHDSTSQLSLRDYEMPDHAVADGKPFRLDDATPFIELTSWFANGDAALEALQRSDPGWAEVRCWPHHFDLGTIISLDPSGNPLHGRSIGAGMSPGDAWCEEPYFYVNPYGLDAPPEVLPELPGSARWHTEGWFGAFITGAELLKVDDPSSAATGFLDGAVAAARNLLER